MAEHAAGLATEKEARDVAEAARESEWSGPSFVRELFLGRFRLDLIHPHPVKSDPAEQARAAPFFAKLRAFLERVDSDMIDRTGEIPESYVQELRDMGAFGIKIPTEYGGLGLSYASYTRAIAMVTSKDGSLTALLSASQSIGLPQPLKLFGTPEQKQCFFPRLAKGAISAFALTEVDAGSDPANLRTSATLSEDGKHWTLNGEKLWCTNGTRADLLVVMARTPDAIVNGKPRKQITAFIVEAKAPGVEIVHRSRFMGLKAIENGVLRFTNVRVPAENILWGEGKGLKLALITLNTGRLTLPASCAGGGKAMLQVARHWAKERVQWGQPIGKHEAVAQKIALMAANTFAMEAVAELTVGLSERGHYDIRLEAAIAKMWNTETGWRIVDDTLQIRGGRGYETAESLRGRGEAGIPVERAMRDFRINLIFEGTSEVMRLFIAREAVDHHFKTAFALVDKEASRKDKISALGRVMKFYPLWYLARWFGKGDLPVAYSEFGKLGRHLRWAERHTRHLGRTLFHAMARFGPKLERRQMVLFRGVDIGADLFAMTAACVRARMLAEQGNTEATELADLFCREARQRIRTNFHRFYGKNDSAIYRVSQRVLEGRHAWLEQGIVGIMEEAPVKSVRPAARSEPARQLV
ncbi:MAG: acyl-CoA dehydrogenase [Gemmatimonadaceae bacterium]|nr:acyl-CoA dehydrogenase [Gemmatimonadaceae bacterium]NUS34731.1 acyl-CoA dehydrogenase [Gemmatimonadaceae bacterium]